MKTLTATELWWPFSFLAALSNLATLGAVHSREQPMETEFLEVSSSSAEGVWTAYAVELAEDLWRRYEVSQEEKLRASTSLAVLFLKMFHEQPTELLRRMFEAYAHDVQCRGFLVDDPVHKQFAEDQFGSLRRHLRVVAEL
jgi:hypothetical protein